MPPSGGAGFAGAAVCAAGPVREDSAWWADERRRLRCRLQAVPALPVPPSAPLARRARIQHDGRVTDAARLAELIRERQPCVVLTGAGVSTESGIPDFRSPQGLWAQFDPFEYGSIEAFRADPEKVWRFYAPRFAVLTDAEPNAAHLALARPEEAGLVRAVVTQNIDLLHERAGSREVVEVHGSIRTSSCPGCGASYPLPRVLELLEDGGVPHCSACGTVL